MGKLKALLLTEGMHGMISQVEGMAKALNTEYSHKIVRLSFPWNLIPPKFTPISDIILKDKTYLTEGETPGLIILRSCCFVRHVIILNLAKFFATPISPTPSILAAIIGMPDH